MKGMESYRDVSVMTADGVQLIVMLCEGVIRFNRVAKKAIENGDIAGRTVCINKSIAIVSELSGSLNMDEGGSVATNLFRLYDYCIRRLTEANSKNDASALDDVTRIFVELKGGWETVSSFTEKTDLTRQPLHAAV